MCEQNNSPEFSPVESISAVETRRAPVQRQEGKRGKVFHWLVQWRQRPRRKKKKTMMTTMTTPPIKRWRTGHIEEPSLCQHNNKRPTHSIGTILFHHPLFICSWMHSSYHCARSPWVVQHPSFITHDIHHHCSSSTGSTKWESLMTTSVQPPTAAFPPSQLCCHNIHSYNSIGSSLNFIQNCPNSAFY